MITNEFDIKAASWDTSNMNIDRAKRVADEILQVIPVSAEMSAMEFGAGTGLLSFLLRGHLKEITMIENSAGMLKVLGEKIIAEGAENMKVLDHDLENDEYRGSKFDLIYTLMALHHVTDVGKIINTFSGMLNRGGHLAIADLYSEDGSFHGAGFTGHRGFDTESLSAILEKNGFTNISHREVYVIDKMTSDNSRKHFRVFLMTAVLAG